MSNGEACCQLQPALVCPVWPNPVTTSPHQVNT